MKYIFHCLHSIKYTHKSSGKKKFTFVCVVWWGKMMLEKMAIEEKFLTSHHNQKQIPDI